MEINAKNERLKRCYVVYLKEAKQLDEQSIDAVEKALDRFETFTKRRDFRAFKKEQAIYFKGNLANQKNVRTGERLSRATVHSTLSALKDFFFWLAGQPGFKSRLSHSDADYFKLSLKEVAIAKRTRIKRVPTLDQIRAVLAAMPTTTPEDLRNRALVAFTIATGARDNAIASTRLKHFDAVEKVLDHDPRDMRVKFAKSFPTVFFRVGDDIETIVIEWVDYLQGVHGFGPSDPLFPPTKIGRGDDGNFASVGFSRECWANASPIRAIFKEAFAAAGLPYFNPHSFRDTLARLGMERCLTPELAKAWSQNLGHDDVLTTFTSYGTVPAHRQVELVRTAGQRNPVDEQALELFRAAMASVKDVVQ